MEKKKHKPEPSYLEREKLHAREHAKKWRDHINTVEDCNEAIAEMNHYIDLFNRAHVIEPSVRRRFSK